jgi:hypothetical protein
MFIGLTLASNRHDIFVRADTIMTIERNMLNPLEVVVVTNNLTPRGPMMYAVLNSQKDIADAISRAISTQTPQMVNVDPIAKERAPAVTQPAPEKSLITS